MARLRPASLPAAAVRRTPSRSARFEDGPCQARGAAFAVPRGTVAPPRRVCSDPKGALRDYSCKPTCADGHYQVPGGSAPVLPDISLPPRQNFLRRKGLHPGLSLVEACGCRRCQIIAAPGPELL